MTYGDEAGALPVSEPLTVRVTMFSQFRRLLLWGLPLSLLVLRENRTRKALWALLPCYAWLGIGAGFDLLDGGIGEVAAPMAIFLGGLLLLGKRIGSRSGGGVVLLAAVWAGLIHGVQFAAGAADNWPFTAMASGLLCLQALLGFGLARLCCRRRYGALRLALFLLPLMVSTTLLVLLGVALVMILPDAGPHAGMILIGVTGSSLVAGGLIYVLHLSFLAVPFASEFHRERLCALLKLKREPPPLPPARA